jgi:hypothetical protein
MRHERLNLLLAKEIGHRSLALRVEYPVWGQFMTAVGGPTKAGKANDGL